MEMSVSAAIWSGTTVRRAGGLLRAAKWLLGVALVAALSAQVNAADPFLPTVASGGSGTARWVRVVLPVPEGHYLYVDNTSVKVDPPFALEPVVMPKKKVKYDTFSDADVEVYAHDSEFTFRLTGPDGPASIRVRYQGCNEKLCFLPGNKSFTVAVESPADVESASGLNPASDEKTAAQMLGSGFRMTGRAAGYLPPDEFLAFLDRVESGKGLEDADSLRDVLSGKGVGLLLLIVLAGGLLLNLTPCVLPMIPVNLAIIGAGVHGSGRGRGMLLGAAYGAGMALSYGALGVVVVLTGSSFGTVNASPAFNFGIAGLFLLLALAMFDVIHVDFSRFQSGGAGKPMRRGSFVAAFALGALSALLAGACVAPVLISVMLLSADLYASGNVGGLALPFVLGLGMALPWPIAGAGLAFLPKPGAWMQYVKFAFGVLILGFALWYGMIGYRIARGSGARVGHVAPDKSALGAWTDSLASGLARAREENKPVLLDFWATWCKNCSKMETTTFASGGVMERLNGYVLVRFQAEDPSDPAVSEVMSMFGLIGLPSYVVLEYEGQTR